MRLEATLVVLILLTAGLAGCLDGGEPLSSNAGPSADEQGTEADDGETGDDGDAGGSSDDPDGVGSESSSTNTTGPADGGDGGDGDADGTDGTDGSDDGPVKAPPTAVVAHIDSGINPYHVAFRDDSALADVHPSRYIPGFPEDAKALNLTLDAPDLETALEQDAHIWENVTREELYWIPGTRIAGAISLGAGGTYCTLVGTAGDATGAAVLHDVTEDVNDTAPANTPTHPCPEERIIFDDFGHGTMTASRAAGDGTSLCSDCRLVTVEGLGADSVRWAANQGWIDVQTNSWLNFVPAPANQQLGDTSAAFAYAAERMVTVAASGNGAGYVGGFVPTPTYGLSTAAPGVVLVGGHDNGHLAPWSGSPPHVVADGFRGLAATNDSLTEISPNGFSCCTSSAAPYAAGGLASLIQEARGILDNRSTGVGPDGLIATGPLNQVIQGPLSDGNLTLGELRTVLFHTAEQRMGATTHDGDTHWTGNPGDAPEDPVNPGENRYCPGCWTLPITYQDLPPEVPLYPYTGYGAINVHSDRAGVRVLAGLDDLPDRPDADEFYAVDQTVREQIYP